MHAINVGKWDIFQRDCKYDGDKPMDGQQEQDGSFDSYDPVVGKWMTNLVATTPITAKAMKSLYAELNRQKDLKRTYRWRYKDLQAIAATTDTPTTVLCPIAIMSSKVTPKTQVTKTIPAGQNKKAPDKGKAKPLGKMKKNVAKSTPNTVSTAGPSANLQSQLRDKAKPYGCFNTRNNRRLTGNRRGIIKGRTRIGCHPRKWFRTGR